jgi:hypothetical protein
MNLEPNRLPTEFRMEWTAPATTLVFRHTRPLDAEEVRQFADVVERIEAMREEIKGCA